MYFKMNEKIRFVRKVTACLTRGQNKQRCLRDHCDQRSCSAGQTEHIPELFPLPSSNIQLPFNRRIKRKQTYFLRSEITRYH